MENDVLSYSRNEMPMTKFSDTAAVDSIGPRRRRFAAIQGTGHSAQRHHEQFCGGDSRWRPTAGSSHGGIYSVELANAMLLSSFENETISLPLDSARYESFFKVKLRNRRPNQPGL